MEEEKREEKEEKTGRRRRWLLWGLIVLAVLAAGAFFLSDRFGNMLRSGSHYTLTKTGATADLDADGVTMTQAMGDLIVRSNGGGVCGLTASGTARWDVAYTMSWPYLLVSGDYAAVADRKGTDVVVVNRSGKNTRIQAENKILLHAVNEAGTVAVVTEEADGHSVTLYSFDGTKLLKRRTYQSQDGIPVAVALSADGKRMVTACVAYSGLKAASTMTAFDLSASGSTLVDRVLGSKKIEGTLISELHYIGSYCVYAGDDRIGSLDTASGCKEVWEKELTHRLSAMAYGSDSFAVMLGQGLAGTAEDPEYNLWIYDAKGTALVKRKEAGITALEAAGDIYVCGSARSYTAVNLEGETAWFADTEESYRKIMLLEDHKTAAAQDMTSLTYYKVTELTEEDKNQ